MALVTGASGRLGRMTVAAFERAGFRVAAVVRDDAEARLVPVLPGGDVRCFTCDVTDEGAVIRTFDGVGEAFGRLDALLHTVGAWDRQPFLETTLDAWDRLLRINLTSTMLCFREAARIMLAGSGGRLIGITSGQGADGGAAGQAAYSAAKAGVIRLVESVQLELGPSGITAHALAPSTLRFDDADSGPGIRAADVVDRLVQLAGDVGTGGDRTVRMYG